MSLKSKAMMKLAKQKPQYLFIPFVPIGLTIGSFVLSLLAFRKARRLSLQMMT